jgi:hypothetical protein
VNENEFFTQKNCEGECEYGFLCWI